MATKVPTARDLAPPTTNVPTAPPIINDTYQAIQQVHVNSSRSSTSCYICWKTFDDELRERGFEGSDIEFNDIIIAGQDQVDTSKLKNMLRLKVFIAPVYLPLDHHIKFCCCDCYCYCELCNYSEALSSMPTPTCSDYFESFCLTIFRHCSVWLSCCCCYRGISCSTIQNSLQQEFQIKHSIQYDGVTFKFWKLPGYLGVRIDGNEKKVALKLDKFVRIENVLTKKQYAVCVTDVYDES